MTTQTYFIGPLIFLCVGLVVGFFFARWLVGRYVSRTLSNVAVTIKDLSSNHAELLRKLEVEKRKSTSYREVIEGIQGERNRWKTLYFDECSMHGNAQQLLLNEIGSLAAQYRRATNKQPVFGELVKQITSEYAARHPTPNPPPEAPGFPNSEAPTHPSTPKVMASHE